MRRSSEGFGQRCHKPQLLASAVTAVAAVTVVAASLLLVACGGSSNEGDDSSQASATSLEASPQTVTTATPGPPPGATLEGFRDVEVGDCFEEITDSPAEDSAVWLLDCADPHDYEAYWITDYLGPGAGRGTSYPGTATVQNFSEQSCFDQFETFVGVRWTLSELDIRAWWPSEESWARADRKVICTVYSESGEQLSGTQRGSAQ